MPPKQTTQGSNPSESGTPDTSRYDQMQVMAALIDVQKDVTSQSVKVERLLADREKDAKSSADSLGDIQKTLGEIKGALTRNTSLVVGGFAVGCVALLMLWFFIGDDVKALYEFARSLPRAT